MDSNVVPISSVLERLINPCVITGMLVVITLMSGVEFNGYYLVLAIIAFFISSQVFERVSLLRSWRKVHFVANSRGILLSWLMVIGILLFLGYATKLSAEYSRDVLLIWFIVSPIVLFLSHVLARVLLSTAIQSKGNQRTAVIATANHLGQQLFKKIKDEPNLGTKVEGFFDDRSRERLDDPENQLQMLGKLSELPGFVRQQGIDIVYLTLPMSSQPRILKVLDELYDTTASIYFVPDIFIFEVIQARFDNINGVPVVALCETPIFGVNGILKRLSDIVLAGIALLALSPLMLLIALGIKLSSPGPVLFKQRRYGLNGKEILVYKFRSMTVCEDGPIIQQATIKDHRTTRLGAFLRKTSLDELPQFINVLQGQMSIVGPRPHAVAHNEMYRKFIKGYMIRHKVKPGITGWAQVHGLRGETETVEKMKARIEYDLDYLRNWSLPLDLWIMFRTAIVIFKSQSAY